MVSYTNRDSNAFLQVQHLSQFFLNTRSSTLDFTKIMSVSQYWIWLQTIFISNIRVQSWYNGDLAENMTDYLNDKTTRIIGWATMRQLRLRLNASCRIPAVIQPVIDTCKGSYSIFSDERGSFAPGWVSSTNVTYSSSIQNSFIYRSSAELDSYIYIGDHGTYGGGGYVYEFRGDLNDLQQNLTLLRQLFWIDEQSRAILIQLNLYNPNIKFYTSVILLVEITITGEIFPEVHVEPMQMYTEFNDFSSIFYLIIASIYMVFIIYFTIMEIHSICKLKKKYFCQIRSYIEWGVISCSWAGVGIYILRYHEAKRIGNYFRQTNGFNYINLELATYMNGILTFLLGFCCFFGTIRLLQVFEIYPRINMFLQTLSRAFKDIVAFSLMFYLLFFGFVILFYLLFVSKMQSCSSLLQTSGMLFEMLLLKFDFSEIHNADAFLGPSVFVLFIYFVVFICITMFVAIIVGHFRFARKQMQEMGYIHIGAFSFFIEDMAKRTAIKTLTKEELQAEKDIIIRAKYKNPIDQFPAKVEELLIALHRTCITHLTLDVAATSENKDVSSSSTSDQQQKRAKKKHIICSN